MEFVSFEKIIEPTTKEVEGEKAIEWGREKGEEELQVNLESILSLLIPISSSDVRFSDKAKIKMVNGKIIRNGEEKFETCIINEELKKV